MASLLLLAFLLLLASLRLLRPLLLLGLLLLMASLLLTMGACLSFVLNTFIGSVDCFPNLDFPAIFSFMNYLPVGLDGPVVKYTPVMRASRVLIPDI
jgi:hypothetical protein